MAKKDIKENLYVVKVLDAMRNYLHRDDNNFHDRLFMAYCGAC